MLRLFSGKIHEARPSDFGSPCTNLQFLPLCHWHCWTNPKLLNFEVILQSWFCYNTIKHTPFGIDIIFLESIFAMTCQPTRLQAERWFQTSPSLRPPRQACPRPHYPSLSNGCPLAQPLKWGKASLRLGGRCPIWDRLPHSKHGQLCPKLSKSGDGGGFLVAINSWDVFYIYNSLLRKSYNFDWSWT